MSSNSTEKKSVHSRMLALYTCENERLSSISGRYAKNLEAEWENLAILLKSQDCAKTHPNEMSQIDIDLSQVAGLQSLGKLCEEKFSSFIITVYQLKLEDELQTRGMVCIHSKDDEFGHWFVQHVLSHSALKNSDISSNLLNKNNYTELVTHIFEQDIRNIAINDAWEDTGKDYFKKVIDYFTSRMLKIEACLPAFPCKSSNSLKVAGSLPDKGEELALRQLVSFAKKVNEVYPPGMKIWIISDGHVFSDCIGANDRDVDEYSNNLQKLAKCITSSDVLDFQSLPDIFSLKLHTFQEKYVQSVEIQHYLETDLESQAEVCRKIMMASCSTDDRILRKLIEQQDPNKLALYRGFSKFMEEDLALIPMLKSFSRNAKKKLCGKVAFEMIKRNEAYSNLVELMYPFHLRLSIHAHVNSGPKFGIRLLSNKECKIIRSLKTNEETPVFDDLLHIPTPWHNCVIQLENENFYFIGKSSIAVQAVARGHYSGQWIPSKLEAGKGGYFCLKELSKTELLEKMPTSSLGQAVPASIL